MNPTEYEKSDLPDHFEDVETNNHEQNDVPLYDVKETKRIIRKVDFRLLPMLTLLYVFSFIDRSNSMRTLSLLVQTSANKEQLATQRLRA